MHSSQRTIDDMMKISDNMMGCGFNTYKNIFNIKHHFPKNESHTLDEIAKLTGYKKKGLQTIYNKGVGAYHTNPLSVRKQVKSPEQWAMGRVYASINPESKAYRVDKSHLIKGGMIGGMAKFNAEGNIVERKDVKNDDGEIEGITYEITDYIDTVNEDKDLNDKEKFNEIMKQVGDLKELYKVPDITETDKKLIKSKIKYINNVLNEDKYDNFDVEDYEYEKVKGNPLYEAYEETAKTVPLKPTETIDTKRGDINEDNNMEYDTDTGMLQDYDGDKSNALDSKDLFSYDPLYIKYLSGERFNNKWDINKLTPEKFINLRERLIENFLRYYPVDTIKNNTLWELKSYKTPTKNESTQELQRTKIEGTNQYQIRYKQNNKGEWVIDNIYDKDYKMNTLPNRPDGYKYYWGFNNKDGIAETNPLKSPNFIPKPVRNKNTGDILYYKGDWNPHKKYTKNDRPTLKIDNNELHREPNRYSNKYLKIINKFGIKK